MAFPRLTELAAYLNVFLVTGPILLGASAICWWQIYKSYSRNAIAGDAPEWRPTRGKLYFFGLLTLLIGYVHFSGTYSCISNAISWRTVRPENVTEIEVVAQSEWNTAGSAKTVSVRDQAEIVRGLESLATAASWSRNHETLSDGYRLRLKLAGQESFSDYYLTAFRHSSRGGAVWVVIPHIGKDHQGVINHAGEYQSLEFHDWLKQVIDPLFPQPGK